MMFRNIRVEDRLPGNIHFSSLRFSKTGILAGQVVYGVRSNRGLNICDRDGTTALILKPLKVC